MEDSREGMTVDVMKVGTMFLFILYTQVTVQWVCDVRMCKIPSDSLFAPVACANSINILSKVHTASEFWGEKKKILKFFIWGRYKRLINLPRKHFIDGWGGGNF